MAQPGPTVVLCWGFWPLFNPLMLIKVFADNFSVWGWLGWVCCLQGGVRELEDHHWGISGAVHELWNGLHWRGPFKGRLVPTLCNGKGHLLPDNVFFFSGFY